MLFQTFQIVYIIGAISDIKFFRIIKCTTWALKIVGAFKSNAYTNDTFRKW